MTNPRRLRRSVVGVLGALLAMSAVATAQPPPAPPYPPAPPPRSSPPAPPPRSYPPPAVVEAAPPPLSPAMRVIYAPFYAAGLVIRYGVYYVIVAPLEVFGRALNHGVEGGVSRGDDR